MRSPARPIGIASVLVVALALVCAAGCGAAESGGEILGGDATLIESGGAWAPDSGSIARVGEGGIEIISTDGEVEREIPVKTPARGLAWTADGRRILFLSKEPHQKPDRTERVGSVRLGSRPRFAPLGTHAGSLGWSPGGWPMVFATTYLYIEIGHGPVGPRSALWTKASLDAKPKRILNLPGEERYPRVSPDGGTVVFSLDDRRGRAGGTWVVGIDGKSPRRLTPAQGEASWSPDGGTIALAATAPGDLRTRLYTIPAAGGPLNKVSGEELLGGPPAWSPDGTWLTYSNWEGAVRRIHPDGSGAMTVADFPGQEIRDLAWSPDGRYLSYTAQPHHEGD